MRQRPGTAGVLMPLIFLWCVLCTQYRYVMAENAAAAPNIVWIWADNLAYGDLSCYGNSVVQTPAIDQLAADGVRLTQYYVAHTVCSPSRAGFLTGRQPFRAGIVDVLRPDSPSGLPAEEITIAEVLRDQGYATLAVGKWHLGDHVEYLPTRHGFDHYFGLPYSMDMLPTILYDDEKILERLPGEKVGNITERLVDRSVQFMEENRDRPFFLYFNHTLPHPPITLPDGSSRTSNGKRLSTYEAAIEHLDRQTETLLSAIDAMGLRERTLVIFTSDNGPMSVGGDTGGLRGRIAESYEGGVRVPLVARWPNNIPPGRVVDTPCIALDFFPTFATLSAATLPDDRIYDGQDIWPVLSGEGKFERQAPFYWVQTDNVTSTRDGDWKLHVGHRRRQLSEPELYNLREDPGELNNIASAHPEVVDRLRKQIEAFQADIPKAWSLVYPVRDPKKRPSGVRRE